MIKLKLFVLTIIFLFFTVNLAAFEAENKGMSREAKKFADDADFFQKNNNFKEAERSLVKAISYEPKNSTLHTKLGIVYHAQFEVWQVNNPSPAESQKKKVMQETIFKAIKEQELAVSLDSQDSVPHFFLGMEYKSAYEATNHERVWLTKSINEFDKIIKFDPENMLSYHMLGVINYVDLGNIDSAEKYFLKALEIEPRFIESHMFLANIYIEKSDLVLAREELEKIKLFDPKNLSISKLVLTDLETRINNLSEKKNPPSPD